MNLVLHTPDGVQYRDASLIEKKGLAEAYIRLMICGFFLPQEKELFYLRLLELDEKLNT